MYEQTRHRKVINPMIVQILLGIFTAT